MKKVAVVLFNLGGPLTQADVKPFLYNLFSDRFIINLPAPFERSAGRLISSRREVSAQANYQLMGGGSPIVRETEAQAEALTAHLKKVGKGSGIQDIHRYALLASVHRRCGEGRRSVGNRIRSWPCRSIHSSRPRPPCRPL